MKKILLVGILIITLILITTPIASANEPPSCSGGGWKLLGPPVVGTLVIKLVRIEPPYNILSFKFKGCCADCFKRCEEPSCDVIIKLEAPFTGITPDNFPPEWLQDYNLIGWGPKGCFSRKGGEDLVVTNILKYEVKDTNGDGINEAFADIVMYYWECNP